MKFPKGTPILENMQLDFINLDKLITAAKRERAHRISGYISIIYHDSVELIFLKDGEPFNAARIGRNVREIAPIKEIIDHAKNASYGILAEYATEEKLLNLIISSIILRPLSAEINLARVQPKLFLERLKLTKFNGFVLVRSGLNESFIYFDNGDVAGCYVAGTSKKLQGEEIVQFLSMPNLKIAIYDHVEVAATTQASPAQCDMFCKIFSALLKNYSHPMGQSLVVRTVTMAKTTAQKEFPFIEQYSVESDLVVSGKVVVDPQVLVKGMARWFDLIVESFSTLLGKESEVIAKKTIHDYRFALKSLGFFDHTKIKA